MDMTHAHFNLDSFDDFNMTIDVNGGWIFGRDGESYGKLLIN